MQGLEQVEKGVKQVYTRGQVCLSSKLRGRSQAIATLTIEHCPGERAWLHLRCCLGAVCRVSTRPALALSAGKLACKQAPHCALHPCPQDRCSPHGWVQAVGFTSTCRHSSTCHRSQAYALLGPLPLSELEPQMHCATHASSRNICAMKAACQVVRRMQISNAMQPHQMMSLTIQSCSACVPAAQ